MARPYGFKCDKCGFTCLDDTTTNGWPCPQCKSRAMFHDINVQGGRLDAYTGLGCYPIIYIDDRTGDVFCAKCAEEARDNDEGSGGLGVKLCHDAYMEGPVEYCAECNDEIESAYGDPDNKED